MFHLDGVLFKDAFGTPAMRDVMCEERYIELFLETEAALARVEAELGLIPADAAETISAHATLDSLDLDAVETNVAEIDLFTMAIIGAWRDEIGDAGEYIHWGATSQDIADTAMVLQLRKAAELLRDDLDAIRESLADLAETHAATPMIGRTHFVHAIPITFGLKAATWLDELDRHVDRLDELKERVFVLQFFGAVGTLASLGDEGIAVRDSLGEELDLTVPSTAWFASRDRFVEYVHTLAMVASTLSKIAKQILVLNREEIDEVNEPVPEGEVGSSTMPHKRNPVKSERTVGLAALIRGLSSVMDDVTESYDERDAGRWYAEYAVLPETLLYSSRLVENVREVLVNLNVNPDVMERNLTMHGGLVASEAVMMALAEEIGRQRAHDIVHEVAVDAATSGEDFVECLAQDDRVTSVFSREELEALTEPTAYTGLSEHLVIGFLDERE